MKNKKFINTDNVASSKKSQQNQYYTTSSDDAAINQFAGSSQQSDIKFDFKADTSFTTKLNKKMQSANDPRTGRFVSDDSGRNTADENSNNTNNYPAKVYSVKSVQ